MEREELGAHGVGFEVAFAVQCQVDIILRKLDARSGKSSPLGPERLHRELAEGAEDEEGVLDVEVVRADGLDRSLVLYVLLLRTAHHIRVSTTF